MSNFQPRLQIGQIKTDIRVYPKNGQLTVLGGEPAKCALCQEKSVLAHFSPSQNWAHDGGSQWSGHVVCEHCKRELPATRFTNEAPDCSVLTREHDLESGLTLWVLATEISREDWRQVAPLFERDVELDCPQGRAWNDSITLRWATRQLAQVEKLLAKAHGISL